MVVVELSLDHSAPACSHPKSMPQVRQQIAWVGAASFFATCHVPERALPNVPPGETPNSEAYPKVRDAPTVSSGRAQPSAFVSSPSTLGQIEN